MRAMKIRMDSKWMNQWLNDVWLYCECIIITCNFLNKIKISKIVVPNKRVLQLRVW